MKFNVEQFKHDCIMYGTFAVPIIVIFSVAYAITRDYVISTAATVVTIICVVLTLALWYSLKFKN